jgi:hypothetical protein
MTDPLRTPHNNSPCDDFNGRFLYTLTTTVFVGAQCSIAPESYSRIRLFSTKTVADASRLV